MILSGWRRWCRWVGKERKKTDFRRGRPKRGLFLESLEDRLLPAGTWTALTNLVPGPGGTGTMELLSDGAVMVAGNTSGTGISQNWYALTASANGSYASGTFSALASMHTQREFFPADVLPSGRLFVAGGQYSNDNNGSSGNDTNTGELYNPALNTWTVLPNFPGTQLGDAVSEVLPDGSVLVGDPFGSDTQIFTPSGNAGTWSAGPSRLEDATSAGESWVKLADGSILSYDIQDGNSPHHAERYIPSRSEWIDAGSVPVQLESNGGNSSIEPVLGPGLLLPDGRAFFLGASGHTVFYTPPATLLGTGTWSAGPDIPGGLGAFDAPAAMLNNGKILVAASAIDGTNHAGPTTVFEFDPTANGGNGSFTSVPSAGGPDLSNGTLNDRMLDLPNGQVLFSNGGRQLFAYTPDGTPLTAARPTITGIANKGSFFTLSGTQLTGISEGAAYGADAQMASNYPIIQLVDGSGNVSYTRTANWSSMWPQTGSAIETADFEAAAVGPYLFSVSVNGVSSNSVLFVEMGPGADAITLRNDPASVSMLQVLQNGTTLLGEFPLSSFKNIDINGTGSLTIDHSNGDFNGEAITFNGGGTPSTVTIGGKTGSLFALGYNVNGPGAGELLIDRDTLTFSSIQSITDSVAATSALTITIDPSNAIPGLVTTTFTAGSGASTNVAFSNGLTPLAFANPGTFLRVTGHSGNDHITFNSLGAGFHDTIAVNDLNQGGNDRVDLNTPLNLSTPTARGDLTVYASSINVNADIDVGSGVQGSVSLQGNITLETDVSITYGVNGLDLGSGNLAMGTNNLTLTDVDPTNSGFVFSKMTGSGNLNKTGPGELLIENAANTYAGLATVFAGLLQVNGTLANVTVNGGTLAGVGTAGTVAVISGTLAPGQGSTPGIFTTAGITVPAGTSFNIGIGGNQAGSDNSHYAQQVINSGTVILGGALNLNSVANYVPKDGDHYVILNNGGGSAVNGTFTAGAGIDAVSPGANLPEGAILSNDFLGSHLLATITYKAGRGNDSIAIDVSSVSKAAITSAANTAFTAGTPGAFTVTTSGFPKPSLNDGGFTLPKNVSFTDNGDGTATLAGTPGVPDLGTYNFTITAHNGIGSDALEGFTLTIGQVPAITSPNNAAFTAGTPGTFTVTARGFPAPTLSMSGAPAWVSFTPSTGLLSVSPPANAVGKYVFTLSAANNLTAASQSFTLTINPPPTLTPVLLPPVTMNNFYNQPIGVLGGTGTKTLTYSVSGTLPAGLSIAPPSPASDSITISGTPTALGTATINVSVRDAAGATAAASFTVRIVSIALVPDFLMPGRTMLVVGTARPDPLGTYIQPVDTLGDLSVTVNGVPQGTFKPTGHILVYGNGADAIHLKAGANGTTVSVPAFLIGGDGNETLDASGSSANNVLVGGPGTNVLTGGTGRDILIGGPMYSVLSGGHNQDVLISGTTSYDQNLFALNGLVSEWGRQHEVFNTRVANLQSGAGLNAPYVFGAATVTVDATPEAIVPGSSQNWLIDAPFLVGPQGTISHLTPTLNFSWSPANGADHYLFLLIDMTTGQTVISSVSVRGTSYNLPTSTLPVGHSYRWWAQPVTASGHAGFRSSPNDFQVI